MDSRLIIFDKYNTSEFFQEGVQIRCQEEWPGDFRMQKHCQNNQYEGYENFWDTASSFRSLSREDANLAIYGCIKDWVDKTPDWQMLAYCIKNQYEAFQELY